MSDLTSLLERPLRDLDQREADTPPLPSRLPPLKPARFWQRWNVRARLRLQRDPLGAKAWAQAIESPDLADLLARARIPVPSALHVTLG